MSSLDQIVPTLDDFVTWKGLETAADLEGPADQVSLFLQLASDLLVLATGITEAPEKDSPLGRIVTYGICDMAWYIGTSLESRDEEFSPFSSERIGSYSYSKSVKSVQDGSATGVPFFDFAVKYLSDTLTTSGTGSIGISSESVFPQPFQPTHLPSGFFYRGGVQG